MVSTHILAKKLHFIKDTQEKNSYRILIWKIKNQRFEFGTRISKCISVVKRKLFMFLFLMTCGEKLNKIKIFWQNAIPRKSRKNLDLI